MILNFPPYPICVETPLGIGTVLYIRSNYLFENDEFTVVLNETGNIRHFNTLQVKVVINQTYSIGIKEKTDEKN
jgi:hypothetical protein